MKKGIINKHFVVGGAGFIGSHLCEQLLDLGQKVICFDNLSSGSLANLRQILNHKNFCFVRGDANNLSKLYRYMKNSDLVWHLASYTYIDQGNKNPDMAIKNNFYITKNILDVMRKLRIKKIIYTSSATVYGDLGKKYLSEETGPLKPLSIYGASKLACEGLISAYAHVFDMEALIFRFSTIVGGRMDHGVIYDFIKKLKRDPRCLEVLGNGNQEKPFLFIDDCVKGMIFVLNNYKFNKKSDIKCEIFNLGADTTTSVRKIARLVIKAMNLKNVKIKYNGLKRGWKGDVPVVYFDVSKIKKLGWKPLYSSDDAVKMAIRSLLNQW